MDTILEQVNSAALWFVEFALPMLVQSGVLILILLLADLALRKKVRAVFRYWIWLLVLLKLVLPTSLSSPLSLGYFFGEGLAYVDIAQTTEEPHVTVVDPTPASVPPFIDLANIEAYRQTPIVPPIIPDTEPAVTEPINSPVVSVTPVTWQGAVFLAWLSVVMAMGLLLLQRAFFVRGLVTQAKDANGLMADTLESCRGAMGVKRKLGLKVSANATSPAVCGLFRPVILLPQNLTSSLSSSQLRAVLLHELAHIRRGDLWVNLVQTVLQIIHFYNPLLWVANCIIRRVREQAVDEMVLVTMGEAARQYPQTLVNVAKMAFKRPALSLRLIGVVESKSALAGRIKHILNRPMPKRAKLGILGLAVVIIAAAILLPMASSMPGPPELVIKGIVKDAQTNEPIVGARVFDDGYGPEPVWEQIRPDVRCQWGAITNSAGRYSFLTWPEHHSIKVQAPGYKLQRRSLYSGHFTFNKKGQEIFNFALKGLLIKFTELQEGAAEKVSVDDTTIWSKSYKVEFVEGEDMLVAAEVYQAGKPMRIMGRKIFAGSDKPEILTLKFVRNFKNVARTSITYDIKFQLGRQFFRIPEFPVYTAQYFSGDLWDWFQGEASRSLKTRHKHEEYTGLEPLFRYCSCGGRERESQDQAKFWVPGSNATPIMSNHCVVLRMIPLSRIKYLYVEPIGGYQGLDGKIIPPTNFTLEKANEIADAYKNMIGEYLVHQESNNDFTATLPNGVTVELVGICEHPSEGKQWWRPDGQTITKPYERLNYTERSEDSNLYEVVYRLLGSDDVISSIYSNSEVSGHSFYELRQKTENLNIHNADNAYGAILLVKPEAKSIQLEIGTGRDSDWKILCTQDRPVDSTGTTGPGVVFQPAIEKEGKTYITIAHRIKDSQIRIVAVDNSDRLHKAEGFVNTSGQELGSCQARFNLPADQIREIQFQTQKFRRAIFKNVSLKPNFKTDVQVEVEGAKWARVTTSGGKVGVVGSVDGPAVVVRKVPHPEGTSYFKKFDQHYLLEIVSKSFGQDIMEAIGRKSSGVGSGPGYIQKHIGFGIPFSAKGVDGFRKMRQFRRELRKTITEDIKQTLGIKNAGGGGSGELLHIRYRDQSIIGTINIFFSEKDEDITQIMFVIQEVVTAKDKTDVPVEPGQAAKESDTQNQELSFGPDIELEIPLLVRDDDIFQKAGLVDFETGRLFRLPHEYMKLKKELGQDEYESRIIGWCRENGIDAAPIGVWFIEVNAGGVGLVSEEWAGKIFLQVSEESWDSMIPQELLSRLQGEQLKGEISFDGASDTFAFRTIEGNIGLLKALSVTDNSIKIRYKMVNKPSPPLPDVQVKDTKIAPGSSGEAVDSSELTGRVVDENGNTVADAQVALSTEKIGVLVSNGKLQPIRSGVESRIVQTDSQGMFDLGQMPVENFDLIVAHEKGFAMVESEEFVASGEIHLQPWSYIEGQLAEGRKATENKIWMSSLPNLTWFKHKREYRYETKCDESGHFVFDKVPSGWFEVGYLTRAGKNSWSITSRTPVVVKTGQTTKMRLGGEGRPVTGRFVPPEGYDKSIYFGEGSRSLLTVRPQEPRPDNYDRMTKEQQRQWREQWHKTDEYKKYRDDYWHHPDWRQYTFFIEKNGSFRIDDVIAGKYQLTVWIEERHTGQGRPEEIAGYYGTIEVPEMPGGRSDEPLDLGELELTMHNPLRVGDIAPLFEAKTLDGKDLRLIDYRGKFVLLSFWQPVFHPEKQQLQELYDTYGRNRQLEIIGLGGNDTLDEVKNYVRENTIPWPQIYTGEEFKSGIAKDYGGFGIFLIDPDGRIIAKDLRGDKLKSVVSEALEAANVNKPDVRGEVEPVVGEWEDIGKALLADFNDTISLAEHTTLDSIGRDAEGKFFITFLRDREKTRDQQYRFILVGRNGTLVEPASYSTLVFADKLWEKFSFDMPYHRNQIKEFRLQRFPQSLARKASLPLVKSYEPGVNGKIAARATSAPPGRGSLHFDGQGDYLYVPDSRSLWMKAPFTVEMWIKPEFPKEELENWPSWGLIGKGCAIGTGKVKMKGFGITLHRFDDDPNLLMVDYCTADEDGIYAKPYGRRDFDNWIHLHHVFSPDHYERGHGNPLVIGKFLIPESPFAGRIGEIRIWSGARSRDQISEYRNKPLTGDEPDLVACWTFEQSGGQIAYDISTHRNHARLGTTTDTDDADPTWVTVTGGSTIDKDPGNETDDQVLARSTVGPVGKHALSFDGVDDYLHVAANSTLTLKPPFTIEMWLKPDFSELPSEKVSEKLWPFLSLLHKGKRLFSQEKRIQAGGFMMFVGPSQPDLKFSASLYLANAKGQAYQVDGFSGDRLQPAQPDWLYVSTSCTRESYIPVSNQPLLIGQNILLSGFPFKGQIAEIRIWAGVSSRDQVARYRNKPLNGNEPGLVACWDFKRPGDQVVYDISPNGNHARLGNSEGPDDADPKWIDIKVASHQPGQKTDVQVEVEGR